MSEQEALEIVDLVVEKLHNEGVIPEKHYGNMSEALRHELAELVVAKMEE